MSVDGRRAAGKARDCCRFEKISRGELIKRDASKEVEALKRESMRWTCI